MANKTQATKAKAKVKATPKASVKTQKHANDVLENVNGIVDVVILNDDIYDILYDEALLEEAAIIAALEDEGYDVELMECGC